MLAARVLRRCKPCERRVQTKHHLLFTLALDFPRNSSGRAAFHTPQSCRVITTQRTTHHGSRLELVTRSKHHPDALHLRRTRKPHRGKYLPHHTCSTLRIRYWPPRKISPTECECNRGRLQLCLGVVGEEDRFANSFCREGVNLVVCPTAVHGHLCGWTEEKSS